MMIPIQANITGYAKPATLFSAYDDDSGVLVFAVESSLKVERREGCLLIANAPDCSPDVLFGDSLFMESITAFFTLQAGNGQGSQLLFQPNAERARPAIESDGFTDSGPQYRINPDITSAQIATLATCWYVHRRFGQIARTLAAFGQINAARSTAERLAAGQIVTI